MKLTPCSLSTLHYLPLILVSSYVLFLALILHPQIQAHNVFLHGINYPFHINLSRPEQIKALPKGKVRNFTTKTADGTKISGWHLLPDDFVAQDGEQLDAAFDRALKERGTLVYLHGNAMNRAAPFRIQAYAQFTSLNVNVVAIDYRGFGDSSGSPSEAGLQQDARATYKWIYERQKQGAATDSEALTAPIYIAGQSLGTGVAARLTLDLLRVGHPPEALFLIAPYTSIRNLLTSYKIGGLIPLFWPIGLWKVLSDLADRHLQTRFESDKALYQIIKGDSANLDEKESRRYGNLGHTLPEETLRKEFGLRSATSSQSSRRPAIIISHAEDDSVIPHTHGQSLLDTIGLALGKSEENDFVVEEQAWGRTITLKDDQNAREHILARSKVGGHNGVPRHTVKIFSQMMGLG